MPQVDLETFVSSVCAGGTDRKIACETLADYDGSSHDPKIRPVFISAASPIDFPPESYSLSKEAQLEWLNDNAVFERKEEKQVATYILRKGLILCCIWHEMIKRELRLSMNSELTGALGTALFFSPFLSASSDPFVRNFFHK